MFEDKCEISIYLAYAMLVYCFSSMYYLVSTKYLGTPFKDSLYPFQVEIKKKSANIRRNIFIKGIAIGIGLVFIFRPFSECNQLKDLFQMFEDYY